MKLEQLLEYKDYKDGLKALYDEYNLTLGYATEEINEDDYKEEFNEYGIHLSDTPEDRREQIQNNKILKDTYGWDLTELWDLDTTLFKFLLPRLYVFYKIDLSLEQEFEEGTWAFILESILEALLLCVPTKDGYTNSIEENFSKYKAEDEKITKSLLLLGKYIGKYIRRIWN